MAKTSGLSLQTFGSAQTTEGRTSGVSMQMFGASQDINGRTSGIALQVFVVGPLTPLPSGSGDPAGTQGRVVDHAGNIQGAQLSLQGGALSAEYLHED